MVFLGLFKVKIELGVAKKEDIQIEEYEYLSDNKSFHKIGDMSHVAWGGSDTCQERCCNIEMHVIWI